MKTFEEAFVAVGMSDPDVLLASLNESRVEHFENDILLAVIEHMATMMLQEMSRPEPQSPTHRIAVACASIHTGIAIGIRIGQEMEKT